MWLMDGVNNQVIASIRSMADILVQPRNGNAGYGQAIEEPAISSREGTYRRERDQKERTRTTGEDADDKRSDELANKSVHKCK
jgi:hypothetical protein